MKADKVITEDEAALYDRQIRLWGVEAQKKLLSSRILLVNMQGLGAEIAKNLVLSGINIITVLDSHQVSQTDLDTNFLLPRTSLGKNRAESCVEWLQNLNPLVKVVADTEAVELKNDSFFSTDNFDLVCALGTDLNQLKRIDAACRQNNVLFLSSYVYGLYGYMFVDFNRFSYIAESAKISEENGEKNKTAAGCPIKKEQTEEKIALEERNIEFKSLDLVLSEYTNQLESLSPNKLKRISKAYFMVFLMNKFFETHKRSFSSQNPEDRQILVQLKNEIFKKLNISTDQLISDTDLTEDILGEFCPVNAIVGGIVAQEVIKAISRKNQPIDNLFVFDGKKMSGECMKI